MASHVQAQNSTYNNPVLPGWHSDPSCILVGDTFFCVTSTFISFPGLPIYASKDLINWKHVSHVWNRDSQLPGLSRNTTGQQEGMFAATIRHHDGLFYVVCEYLGIPGGLIGVMFKSADPFDDAAWTDPVIFHPSGIDPDLFWDDDGKVYMATQTINIQEINLETGELSQPPINVWNGTGGSSPEGPHIYKKDGYYYLLIAEGGTELGHAVTMARATNINGPYIPYENNPVLTNRGTDEYFQTIGHADLFQDTQGKWWGICLTTRSGPEWVIYPMGREAALFPVTWNEGEYPIMEPVRGTMSGWPMPPPTRDLPGTGPFNSDPDVYDFPVGQPLPRNLVHHRVPKEGMFSVTEEGLNIIPSRNNLTGTPLSTETPELTGQLGVPFIGRRQTDSLFSFTVDLTFTPKEIEQEAGVTIFLTQFNHIDLGLVLLKGEGETEPVLSLRFRAEGTGTPPVPVIVTLPSDWPTSPIRLQIETQDKDTYALSAMPVDNPYAKVTVATASAGLVSGGAGSFVGSLVGVYATCNGAGKSGQVECPAGGVAHFKRWKYSGLAQYITETESVPSSNISPS
ncbi:hypothetical protein HYFRA_00010450 [Hymenoscyphus fraxineus]|uniref:Beta-xylosidase C-terminal Concanavalin A-like domain-containing protein n=1 Tax=Hymenoscyphus fraxineus TaxID=746836 RepID=A0A9N9L171_9HELO|nr:hypothetical protein HYFRA_00010450 [Hymenoscyphus fraxineus]